MSEHDSTNQGGRGCIRADDALKYAAALLQSRTDWAIDSIAGADCGGDHEIEIDAISDIAAVINGLAVEFGDRRVYSDGRKVASHAWVEADCIRVEHIWHPDPAQEKPKSWRGNLPHDPGTPCPGIYEVTTDPQTQDLHVRVVRSA